MSLSMRYGAPFPSKRIPTKPIALTPPSDEALETLLKPTPEDKQFDGAISEELAEKLRTEHYKKFLPWKTMVPWKEISEDRREPWRLNARTAMGFLRDHR